MVTRIGGLASGMDIDALVEKLMLAERAPMDKLSQQKTTYEWQRDAYREVNTKLKALDTYISDNLVLKTLNTKTASSSNSSLVSATATGSATGTLSIEGVSQLATNARAVGNQVNATAKTKMSDLSATGTIELKAIQANGELAKEATAIEITSDMTVEQFISKVNASSAGVSAVFENGRFSFTAKNSGDIKSGEEIQIESGKEIFEKLGFFKDADDKPVTNFQTTDGENARFMINGIATERSTNKVTVNGYSVELKATFNEQATHSEFETATNTNVSNAEKNLNKALNDLSATYNITRAADTVNFDELMSQIEALTATINGKLSTDQMAVDAAKGVLTQKRDVMIGSQKAGDMYKGLSEAAKSFLLDSNATDAATFETAVNNAGNLTEDEKNALKGLNDFTAVKEAGTEIKNEAAYNSLSKEAKAFLLATSSSDKGNFDSQVDNSTGDSLTAADKEALKAFDYSSIPNWQALGEATTTLNATKADATTLLNTANAYTAAKATEETLGTAPTTSNEAAPITISSTTDVDSMVNKIKEFVTTYNAFIKDLNDKTKESKYRDYAPLTAEQKKEMDEDEIKLWEEKAKSGLLRNDSIVRNALSSMRGLVYETHHGVDNQKFNSLFSVGIGTSKNYNDGGTLEIDEEKLRKAIEEDPNAVEQLFKNASGSKDATVTYTTTENGQQVTKEKQADTRGFLYQLRDSMKQFELNIEKKAGRSTMTDAQFSLGKSLTDVTKRLDSWEDKLKNIEERYWKQFTAMETAINKANQQSSIFAQG